MEGSSPSSVSHHRKRFPGDQLSLTSSSLLLELQDDSQTPGKSHLYANVLSELTTDNVYMLEPHHNEFFLDYPNDADASSKVQQSWRWKERMKTSSALLVICLNLGTEPPDIVKPTPYAKRQCWIEPTLPAQKGLEAIGTALQGQYEKMHPKIKCRHCLDPTADDLRSHCLALRKNARSERLLFHYNGHGVPKPTKNGEIWVFGKHYTHYVPINIQEIRSALSDPAVYVFDCSAAGVLIPYLVDYSINQQSSPTRGTSGGAPSSSSDTSIESSSTVVLAACKADESLPLNPQYPADMFTSCLTTPVPIALRWLIAQNPFSLGDVNPNLAENIPGREGDRKTPKGEIYWIFTAITDTIAWDTLTATTFQKIFRQDLLLASLFRNFLFARRLMKSFRCTPQSYPVLPDTSTHPLWQTWDLTAEAFLLYVNNQLKGQAMTDPNNNMPLNVNMGPPNLPFFSEQLQAFEHWLEFEGRNGELPVHLPIVLQVLLSQTYRLRALLLLKRYMSLGTAAINATLIVGMYPYIIKLIQSASPDIRQVLVAIWAHLIGFDPSCRQEIEHDKLHFYFIQYLNAREFPVSHRCLSAFSLAEICNGYKEGQLACVQLGLHRILCSLFNQAEVMAAGSLKKWAALCLAKLCERNTNAKYLCVVENLHLNLHPLLEDHDPMTRACAVYALGEIFGASEIIGGGRGGGQFFNNNPNRTLFQNSNFGQQQQQGQGNNNNNQGGGFLNVPPVDPRELREAELQLAMILLDSCTDGCVLVRREAMIALSKFVVLPTHVPCFKMITKKLIEMGIIPNPSTTSSSSSTATGASSNSGYHHQQQSHGMSYSNSANSLPNSPQANASSSLPSFAHLSLNNSASNMTPSGTPSSGNFSGSVSGVGGGRDRVNSIPRDNLNSSGSATANTTTTGGNGNSNGSDKVSSGDKVLPWNINLNLSKQLVDAVKFFLESQGIGVTPPSSPTTSLGSVASSSADSNDEGYLGRGSVSLLMANAYVRFWLAIFEVDGKDPHVAVSSAASALIKRITDELLYDEEVFRSNAMASANLLHSTQDPLNHSVGSILHVNQEQISHSLLAGTPGGGNIGMSLTSPSSHPSSMTMNQFAQMGSSQGSGNPTPPFGSSQFSLSNPPMAPNNGSNMFNTIGGVGGGGTSSSSSNLASQANMFRGVGNVGESRTNLPTSNSAGSTHGSATNLSNASSSNNASFSSNLFASSLSSESLNMAGAGNRGGASYNNFSFGTNNTPAIKSTTAQPLYDKLSDTDASLISHLYDWMRRLFVTPGPSHNPALDPLSAEGNLRLHREQKVEELLTTIDKLKDTYKIFDDSIDSTVTERRAREELQLQRSAMISNMPQTQTKFEQKFIINVENAKLTSIVLFHPFQDLLATSDGLSIRMYSLTNGSKLMDIKNTHNHPLSSHSSHARSKQGYNSNSSARITGLKWFNAGYESLLLAGSDNGVINVWRDISDLDSVASNAANSSSSGGSSGGGGGGGGMAHSNSFLSLQNASGREGSNKHDSSGYQNQQHGSGSNLNSNNGGGSSSSSSGSHIKGEREQGAPSPSIHPSHYTSTPNSSLTIATSFLALPDIAETSRGSGLITAFNQESGILAVGGNSPTIRLWDMAREQCTRFFSTGLDTCTSAIASKPLSSHYFTSPEFKLYPPRHHQQHDPELGYIPSTWLLAGFADGTVSVFDDRVAGAGAKTHTAKADQNSWIVDAFIRQDLPQVITATVKGAVKFWDIRQMKVYKTLEVFKQPLTALAVHPCLPVIAAGSHAQVIKVFTTGGDQLGQEIKYHDGFLGQRISPVSSLAFHPYKMLLAAGCADNIVSVYAPSEAWQY